MGWVQVDKIMSARDGESSFSHAKVEFEHDV